MNIVREKTPFDQIKTLAEYKAALQQINQIPSADYPSLRSQGLPEEEIVKIIALSMLPYANILFDPNNADLMLLAREDFVRQTSQINPLKKPKFLNESDCPELFAIIRHDVQELNKLHGKNYPMPALIAAPDSHIASYLHEWDAIKIDPSLIGDFTKDKNYYASIIGHELGHRYQGISQYLESVVQSQLYFSLIHSETYVLNHARMQEARADYYAALLTSPEDVKNMLLRFEEHLFAKRLTSVDHSTNLNEFLDRDDSNEAERDHPSLRHRIALQEILAKHPELLKASDIKFDGSAHITNVEINGRPYTAQQIQDLYASPSK